MGSFHNVHISAHVSCSSWKLSLTATPGQHVRERRAVNAWFKRTPHQRCHQTMGDELVSVTWASDERDLSIESSCDRWLDVVSHPNPALEFRSSQDNQSCLEAPDRALLSLQQTTV